MDKEGEKRDPEGQSDEEKESGKEEGVAGGILKGIGKVIPGLGGLLESLEKSPAFRDRLKEADQEIKRRIKEGHVERGERSGGRPSGRPTGRPPGARKATFGGKPFVKQKSKRPLSPSPEPQERPVDIFDEEDHIRVIAEIPGVEEKDIKVNLAKNRLIISVDKPGRKYRQDLKLPSQPEGKLEKSYKNGILELQIKKKSD